MNNTSSSLLNEKQAAEILDIEPETLQVWRCTKRYNLPFVKIGRNVRYRLADVEAFITANTVGATVSA